MTIRGAGAISIQDIANELGISASGLSLADSRCRALAGVQAGPISLSDFYGKSAASPVPSWSIRLENISSIKGIRSATLDINGTGSVGTRGGSAQTSNWYLPNVTGIGAAYYVKFVSSGQGNFSGTARNTIVNIGSGGVAITVASGSTTAEAIGQITVSIYRDAAGTQLVSTGGVPYDVGWAGN